MLFTNTDTVNDKSVSSVTVTFASYLGAMTGQRVSFAAGALVNGSTPTAAAVTGYVVDAPTPLQRTVQLDSALTVVKAADATTPTTLTTVDQAVVSVL